MFASDIDLQMALEERLEEIDVKLQKKISKYNKKKELAKARNMNVRLILFIIELLSEYPRMAEKAGLIPERFPEAGLFSKTTQGYRVKLGYADAIVTVDGEGCEKISNRKYAINSLDAYVARMVWRRSNEYLYRAHSFEEIQENIRNNVMESLKTE